MLVLSRRPLEGVRVAGIVLVTVLEIKQGKVRLGFQAPDDVEVLRKELWDKQQAELTIAEATAVGHCFAGS